MIDKMNFLFEEIIIKRVKESVEVNAFQNTNMLHEKDSYAKFEVIKVGNKQQEVNVGDKILVNQNGMAKEITIANFGIIPDTYALMNASRIFCIVNE